MSSAVLVTGASGYLASHIVDLLLKQGDYDIVRGTVRSLSNKPKYEHLLQLAEGKKTKLELVEADLFEEESWKKAVSGCCAVIHTASPVIYSAENAEKEILEPAMKGTMNVLKACAATPSVKRVVVTSSGGAIYDPYTFDPNHVYTEKDWNETSTLASGAYYYSKVQAEKAAWKFANEEAKGKFELTVVNPTFIFGAPLNFFAKEDLNTSTRVLFEHLNKLINEKAVVTSTTPGLVDVRDVAKAHIMALTSEQAVGKRILVCAAASTWYDLLCSVSRVIHGNEENYKHLASLIPVSTEIQPQGEDPEATRKRIFKFNAADGIKAALPGFGECTSIEKTLIETLNWLVEEDMLLK